MDNIIHKLQQIPEEDPTLDTWSLEEKKQLLDLYWIISKQEKHIFSLIYQYHGCDSWEDIFRDYDMVYLIDKTKGVEIAINEIVERIHETKNK